jgi:hypothetical protein
MKDTLSIILALFCFLFSCSTASNKTARFEFRENEQGLELYEASKPVFFYQREPKPLHGQYVCNNYIHPLYSLDGDTLTEESPSDHPYHRGVYWAWHQIFIGDSSLGDGWVNQDISQIVGSLKTEQSQSSARLIAEVIWKSPRWKNGEPFINERTTITVYPASTEFRIIDFEIRLRALTENLSIGGSDDEKGYGGFCVRIRLPDDISFTSEKGVVIPQITQIGAGPLMDFSGSFGVKKGKSGLTIICDPCTPNYPAPWILRSESSMQNIVYPGRHRVAVPTDKDIVLKYRLVIHNGEAKDIDFDKLVGGK